MLRASSSPSVEVYTQLRLLAVVGCGGSKDAPVAHWPGEVELQQINLLDAAELVELRHLSEAESECKIRELTTQLPHTQGSGGIVRQRRLKQQQQQQSR